MSKRALRSAERILGVPIAGMKLRAALSFYLAFAAAMQGIVAQAHVHERWDSATAHAGVAVQAPRPAPDDGTPGAPVRDDSTYCALCQVLAAGSAPLAPLHDVPPPREAGGVRISFDQAAWIRPSAVSYSWTSRGPPTL